MLLRSHGESKVEVLVTKHCHPQRRDQEYNYRRADQSQHQFTQ